MLNVHVTTFRTFVATVSRAERSLTVTPRSLVMNSHSSTRRIARRAHVHKAHVGGHVRLVRWIENSVASQLVFTGVKRK